MSTDYDSPLRETPTPETGSSSDSTPLSLGLRPCRGLVLAHNLHSRYFREKDIHRWLAYSARVLDCAKVDVLAWGAIPDSLLSTIRYAREFAVPVSLRTDGAALPDGLDYLVGEGLADVFLCPRSLKEVSWKIWIEACHRLGLPIRLQLQLPRPGTQAACALGAEWAAMGVRSVNLVLADPFQEESCCADPQEGRTTAMFCGDLAEALNTQGVETNIFGFPPELLPPSVRHCAASSRAFFSDYQQYDLTSHLFAQRLYVRSPEIARAALLIEMKRHTVALNITDRWLTQALFVRAAPVYRACLYFAKRLRAWRGTPLSRSMHDPGGVFLEAPGSLSSFSDVERQRATHALGGYTVPAETGDDAAGTQSTRIRYVDSVDRDRVRRCELWNELAREAREWQRSTPPDSVRDMNEWGALDAFMVPEYGATAWLTFASGERVSGDIDDLSPPYILSVTAGGGLAEAVGFRLGPSFTLMCPLVEARHTITLYVRKDGRYVLLRDGTPVEAVRRPGHYPAPHRAPSFGKIRMVVWDIEERISFSPFRIWKAPAPESRAVAPPKYSVVIFCTRFARRLSATLQCLVHQRDFDLSRLEIIVGYVPGMDATEDVLESLRLAHPQLRVIHATFPMQNLRSKGYVLNHCMAMASGDWIWLLDADTLLPPYMLSAIEQVEKGQRFIFPKGRAMLDSETTAKVLLGEIKPWAAWDQLLENAPALRQGEALNAPIGYSQCFRRSCLQQLRYPEYEHFQGADFEFAMALREQVGKEYRLDFPVLHLDHEGSQWFGAERHF